MQKAIDNHPDIIQIITWNDFGEGTTIEPAYEYEYTYLESIQNIKKTAIDSSFHYDLPDLLIPMEIYNQVSHNENLSRLPSYLIINLHLIY